MCIIANLQQSNQCVNLPIVAYAWAIPPPIPPKRPAAAGLMPIPTIPDSISEAVNSNTAPLVEASIHACRVAEVRSRKEGEKLAHIPMG